MSVQQNPETVPDSVQESTTIEPRATKSGEVIATLLIEAGHLTPQQLTYAKRIQTKLTSPKVVLTILKELHYITDEQLRATLSANQAGLRLGDLLVELGYLRQAELDTALHLQRESDSEKKLGEFLVEQRFIERRKLAEVLAYQLGMPYIDPHFTEIDRALVHKGPLRSYLLHAFLPIRRQHDDRVLVAFGDPLDPKAREVAARLFSKELVPAVTTKKALEELLSYLQRSEQDPRVNLNDEKTVVGMVHTMFVDALQERASDIHIEPMVDTLQVRFRCDGILVQYRDFPKDVAPALTSRIKVLAGSDITEKRRHQDGRILFEDVHQGLSIDMRASFFVTIHGESVVLRLLNKKSELLELKEIGMAPPMLEHFCDDALDVPSGVVIITGPTGSGKTTTLYSCVNYLNHPHTSIITAEDPVEYVVNGISQCSMNDKINVTFEETLRHIVRQDPDIIVLGEIRDRFSAETAIQAALTGHKVLTTFHTEDSIGGLLRLMNMDIEAFLIASTVVSVVAQRLLRRLCSRCAEPYRPTPLDLRRLQYDNEALRGIAFRTGRGCSHCRFTGYRGRVGVFELLVLNEMVKDAILAKKTSYEIRRISLETSGLITLLEDGLVKAAKGETTLQEAITHLPRLHKPRPLQQLHQLVGERV